MVVEMKARILQTIYTSSRACSRKSSIIGALSGLVNFELAPAPNDNLLAVVKSAMLITHS